MENKSSFSIKMENVGILAAGLKKTLRCTSQITTESEFDNDSYCFLLHFFHSSYFQNIHVFYMENVYMKMRLKWPKA